jgi:Sec-independent protein translocase protein TatA
MQRLLVSLVVSLLVVGCGSAKQEAASLVEAISRFRKAENGDKPQREQDIARVVCSDAEVCETKRLCEAATRPTAEALLLKAEVERGLADLEHGVLARTDDAAAALPQKLDDAERLLAEGHAAMPACDKKVLALRARYDL